MQKPSLILQELIDRQQLSDAEIDELAATDLESFYLTSGFQPYSELSRILESSTDELREYLLQNNDEVFLAHFAQVEDFQNSHFPTATSLFETFLTLADLEKLQCFKDVYKDSYEYAATRANTVWTLEAEIMNFLNTLRMERYKDSFEENLSIFAEIADWIHPGSKTKKVKINYANKIAELRHDFASFSETEIRDVGVILNHLYLNSEDTLPEFLQKAVLAEYNFYDLLQRANKEISGIIDATAVEPRMLKTLSKAIYASSTPLIKLANLGIPLTTEIVQKSLGDSTSTHTRRI